jgi:hypothetical protein
LMSAVQQLVVSINPASYSQTPQDANQNFSQSLLVK